MLRARSASAASDEERVPQAPLSPEIGQVIADARSEMERLVELGGLQNDPIRHPIQALSVHLDALYKLTLAGSQALAEQIDAAKCPVNSDDMRRAVAQGVAHWGGEAVRRIGWRNVIFGAGLLCGAALIGAVAGYGFRGALPVLVGVRAGAEKCTDQQDGSRLCWIPVYERLPASMAGKS